MTRKSPQKKKAKRGPKGAGPDRKSERPGTGKPKVGKRPHGAKATGRGKSQRTPRVGAGPVRRKQARTGGREPIQAGASVDAGADRGQRGPVPGAEPPDVNPSVQETGDRGGRAFQIGERAADLPGGNPPDAPGATPLRP